MKHSETSVIGHIMMDEIKLKNSIMWNWMNNEVTGFIKVELNTAKLFEHVFGLATKNVKEGVNWLYMLTSGDLG